VWLDDGEIALMGERRTQLVHCPSSNMFLGDGITHIPELLRAGVRIGLGTDGGCTNNRASVFEEMRMTSLLQRVRLLDGTVLPAERAFAMGTRDGAETLGIDAGVIGAGRLADLVAIELDHPSLQPPIDLLKNVVYAMSPQAVTDVWVHGRPVVERGRLTTVDSGDLLARVRDLTKGWRM
jgi:5-methylthioadenosine/S-adenosylhomocysteine deaminase